MGFHRLAMFWRAQEYRVYTYLNFTLKTNSSEVSIARAQKIVELLSDLTDLQLYGVALDDLALEHSLTNIVHVGDIGIRGAILLNPAAKLNSRAGITNITITIPAPNSEFEAFSNDYEHPLWATLKKEVFPYLCLNNGTMVDKAKPLSEVKVITLTKRQLPQAGESPVEAALLITQERVKRAEQKHWQKRSDKTEFAFKREENRYQALKIWADLEGEFYSDALNVGVGLEIEAQREKVSDVLGETSAEDHQLEVTVAPEQALVSVVEDRKSVV